MMKRHFVMVRESGTTIWHTLEPMNYSNSVVDVVNLNVTIWVEDGGGETLFFHLHHLPL